MNLASDLCKEVHAELIVCVAVDALLYELDVRAALLDLLARVEDVLPLVAEYAIHGHIVVNDDTVVHVGLGRRGRIWTPGVWGVDKIATHVISGSRKQDKVRKAMNGNLSYPSFPHPPEIRSLSNKKRDTPILPAINLN